MSFSGTTKDELAGFIPEARHCQIAELAAFFAFADLPGPGEEGAPLKMRMRTANAGTARKFFTLCKKAFNIDVVVCKGSENVSSHHGISVRFSNPEDAARAMKAAGHAGILKQECCRRSFLRGAFLSAGSVSDPEKSYHLEIVCPRRETAELLRDIMGRMGYEPRVVTRKKDFVVYLKDGDQIVRLLGEMGASISFLNIESVRVIKEMRGTVNRQVNCETANLNKTIVSAVRQTEEIRYLRDHGGFGSLTEPLRQIAELRLEYPEASLSELGSLLDPPIGKSGVNHRLRKVCTRARDLRRRNHDVPADQEEDYYD